MRIAHWSVFAPKHSGMYHTTKDMVLAEREAGMDAELIDSVNPGLVSHDGDFATANLRYADLADVYVLHSSIPAPYYGDGTPTAFLMHGAPLYTWQTELYGLEPGNEAPWSQSIAYYQDTTFDRYITFWRDQLPYWQVLDGPRCEERVRYVPRGLYFGERFTPEGPQVNLTGSPRLVIADSFRLFKDSMALWFAAAYFAKSHPEARLHLYGIPPIGTRAGDAIHRTVVNSQLKTIIDTCDEPVANIEEVYRGADILLSSVRGESRVVIEAQACGCDTITQSCEGTHEANFESPESIAHMIEQVWQERCAEGPSRRARLAAEVRERYDMARTVAGLQTVYEEMLR